MKINSALRALMFYFIEKDNEVGTILRKMKKIKNQINVMRKQLRMSYDIDKITELENERKSKNK